MKTNPLTCIDFYKADHRRQYPIGTELVYSNFTPRSTKWLPPVDGTDNRIVFFGLQAVISDFLIESFNYEFFLRPKADVIKSYKRRMDAALGKDSIPVDHIAELHDLGYLPLSIRALPEGSVLSAKIPVFTIENTLPKFFWLTNYLETILSNMLWKASTSATIARKYKKLLTSFAIETGADLGFVQFQAHDFSFRGMSGHMDAVMSGGAHLTSFVGTDTVAAIDFLEDYYGANSENELVGCSVPATEHSVMCMGGKLDERETVLRLITETYPSGIVSIVSDTWDFWKMVTETYPSLFSEIMNRDGKVVIRPDSGDPVKIICGDPDAVEGTPEFKGSVECLWDVFGGTVTDKGYRVLDSHIGLIYGDSITLQRANSILRNLANKGFASSNVVFGVGSFTYELQTRDTLGFAMKATAGIVNGEVRTIFKEPKTDGGGMKKSAKGFMVVTQDDLGNFILQDEVSREEAYTTGCLKEVFRDGKQFNKSTLSEIRTRVNDSLSLPPED